MSAARTSAVAAALAFTLAACGVPVEAGLDDAEANRVFLALDRAGVDATKEPDPAAEGRWRVNVAREDVARALLAMKEEDLPRREVPAAGAAAGKGSLVPSEAEEQAQMLAATAQELRASLESIEGVLGARVHVSVPPAGGLREGPQTSPAARASASVLFEHRGATPPVSADSVQRLVAGAVAGLAPTDVAVVMVSRSSPAAPAAGVLSHVGPIAVARSSAQRLQGALAGLVSLAAVLAGAVLFLYSRLAQARAVASAPAPGPGDERGGERESTGLRPG
jgi:type III secretion protein J